MTNTLKDFTPKPTKVDKAVIKEYTSENQFMSLSIELLKEAAQITTLLSSIHSLDENNKPRRWTRDEAVLGGLMVRINKLQRSYLDQVCQSRMEIAFIIFRCLFESIVNLKYLINNKTKKVFDDYIEYSLKTEKKFLNKINSNIQERGKELPIETRMDDFPINRQHSSSLCR